MSEYPAYYAYPSAPPVVKPMPDPVRLHWGWVFGLSVITFGFFGSIWLLVMAIWAKKVSGRASALYWSIAYVLYIPGMFFLGVIAGVIALVMHTDVHSLIAPLQLFARIAGIGLYVGAAYSLKSILEAEPINIPLGGVMTFLFAPYYFQYHLFDFTWPTDFGVHINPPAPQNVAPAPMLGFHGETLPPVAQPPATDGTPQA